MGGDMLSCGIVLARKTDAGWLTLMLRAYHHWDFPKGLCEEGEEPVDAAVREVCEETSIDDVEFLWGDRYTETGPYSRGKVARYYLAESPQGEVVLGVNPALGRPEHHEFRWMTYEQAGRVLGERVAAILEWVHGVTVRRAARPSPP